MYKLRGAENMKIDVIKLNKNERLWLIDSRLYRS